MLATDKGVVRKDKSEGSHQQIRGNDAQKLDTGLHSGWQAGNGLHSKTIRRTEFVTVRSSQHTEGTPQGSPLFPPLSNTVLNGLDKELERRGHRFVRYTDDCNIFVRSHEAGERVIQSLNKFIKNRLKLKINGEKSKVYGVRESKF